MSRLPTRVVLDRPWVLPLAVAACLLGFQASHAQAPVGIESEELDEAPPPVVEPREVDATAFEVRFAAAVEVFESADQPASLALFAELVDELEPLWATGALGPEARSILVDSLAYRARVQYNLGFEAEVGPTLQRMLSVDPNAGLDRDEVSPKLLSQFDRLRRQLVGELVLTLDPPDQEVRVDDQVVDALAGPVGVAAGNRRLQASRPGHEPFAVEIEVDAGSSTALDLTLPRTSAVLRVHTRPAGAEVFVDGLPLGVTRGTAPPGFLPRGAAGAYRREEFSDELVVDGLEPGLRIIEVRGEGYRPYRNELMVDDLYDFALPPIVLEEERGVIAFRNLPADADLRIDGEPVTLDNPGSSSPRLTLPPGEYELTVAQRASRMFTTRLLLGDRQTAEIDVRLKPGLAFLGVLGGDGRSATNLDQALRRTLADSGKWTLLDRSAESPAVLAAVNATADTLRAAASAEAQSTAIDWQALQGLADRQAPGLVYMLAVLDNDLVARHADVWIWPAAPGPARPDRVRLALGDAEAMAALNAAFHRPIELRRPWLGALVADSAAARHPVVFDVTPSGPAEAAGLSPGDLIVGVGGLPIFRRADLDERVAAASPGESLDLAVQSVDGPRTLQLQLGSSPAILGREGGGRLESVIFTELVLMEETAAASDLWLIRLDQALLLMRATDWQEAVRRLRGIDAPETSHGVGRATVDYCLGVALAAAGPEFFAGARERFERAAALPEARLFHHDDAWVAVRARSRLDSLGAER